MLKYLYTWRNGEMRDHGLVEISDQGFLSDGTPIEDYGDYLICDEPSETPFEDWLQEDLKARGIEL
jgi:hypothetical protein